MVYCTWADYVGRYHGAAVPQADFERLARQASGVLDVLTFGRIDNTYAKQAGVVMAACAVCEVLWAHEQMGGQVISRERLDDYEVAYAQGGGVSLKRRLLDAARVYLWQTGLLSMAVKGCGRHG